MSLVSHVGEGQVTAWHYRVPELPDDVPWVFGVPQAVQDAHEDQCYRLVEIEQAAHLLVAEYLLRLAQIGHQGHDARASHQRCRVVRHHGIDVDVHDTC